jgi:AmmeMemoRadiSam system protein B
MALPLLRAPAAAGSFYDIDIEMLRKQIETSFKKVPQLKKKPVKAAIVPHAGYIYSGSVAAYSYSQLEKTNYIILGVNHYGIGTNFALMKKGLWKTPLGEVVISENVADKLLAECKLLEYDVIPHEHEHSIEVQLPFLQYKFGSDFKFIPIAILNEASDESFLDSCRLVGKAIAKIIKKEKDKWTILASSDFSHYIPKAFAEKTDKYIIKSILKMNESEFFSRVSERNASICGFGAIATSIVAANELGAKKAELLKYATSADVTQDDNSVVGYASIVMF